ncbi:hypothetical protein DFH28DRAFT_910363, partial [Melampsora americana]
QQVCVKCGSVGLNCEAKIAWETTDLAKQAQISYLHWEGARIVLKGGQGSESIWACIDFQLLQL